MSRKRLAVALLVLIGLISSLAALAAVATSSAPVVTAAPQVHREGSEGYFSLKVALPRGKARTALAVRVDEGEIFLAHAAPETVAVSPDHAEDDEATAPRADAAAVQHIVVTGRYRRAGPARVTLLSGIEAKPLVTVGFRLPEEEASQPQVRTAWARQQQDALVLADLDSEDSFTHYWNLVVAPKYGIPPRVFGPGTPRREPPDLYSVFTGAAAIQESLQLEALGSGPQSRAQSDATRKAAQSTEELPLARLAGPGVKSHPFTEMLKGRNPQLPTLASAIPADQYAVFFSDINKEIELADLMDEWGGNLLQQMEASARDFHVREKLSRQLCLENSLLTRMFGDRAIGAMAFTGSDPFLKEGTGFTVLFTLKDRKRFESQLEKRFGEAARLGASRSEFTMDGHRGMAIVSPDRRISSHALIIGETAVVSTSRRALERVVATLSGRVVSLANAPDFRYMRTIFPQDSKEEDIFIYLSDPHIRELVGPRHKIGEARRMRCSANMTLVNNASLWFKAEKGREPSYQELASGGYLGANPPTCPDRGSYTIDKNGATCCSLHNRPGFLTPVEEVPLERVSAHEAAQYKAFVENYNRYWTQFFDPIGIRIKMGQNIRVQTCILPLIENSWYDGLAAFSGRKSGTIAEESVLPRTVLSLRARMAPEWLRETGLVRQLEAKQGVDLGWLGNDFSLNLCDGQVLFTLGDQATGMLGREVGRSSSLEPLIFGYLASALNLPTYLSVKVNDPQQAKASIPRIFRALAPGHGARDGLSVETYTVEDHLGRPLYVANFNLFVVKLRLYSAVVKDRLVIASRRNIITDLMDAAAGKKKSPAQQDASLELAVYRSAFKELAEVVNLGYMEEQRHACQKNLPLASIMESALGMPHASVGSAIFGVRGYDPYCPAGGRYLLAPGAGGATCSVHGNVWAPRQPAAGEKDSPTMKLVNSLDKVNARLAFTPEGLMTTLEIRRK